MFARNENMEDIMHDCPNCGMACDCDLEDTWLEAPDDCCHECESLDDDDYLVIFDERACRVCGCTDMRGCPEGCWWVEDDLCSVCAEKAKELEQDG
jgi:hypothetical protein